MSQYLNISISKRHVRDRGMSLIEVAVGIGLVLLIGGALTSLGLMAVSTANEAKLKNVATRLAEERIEVVRGTRDANKSAIQTGNDWSTVYALNETTFPGTSVNVGGLIFYRRTNVAPDGPAGRNKVEVVVAYDYKGRTVASTQCSGIVPAETRPHICLTTYLTKWQ